MNKLKNHVKINCIYKNIKGVYHEKMVNFTLSVNFNVNSMW